MGTHIVFLGLGTNLGNREHHISQAIRLIGERVGIVQCQSSLYETEPWGFDSIHRFINAVVRVETSLQPREVLVKTQQIEREMGRVHKSYVPENATSPIYEDRVIDIDILLYDDVRIDEPDLKIPHPLMSQRDFVMNPLREILDSSVQMTEKEKMLAGEVYSAVDTELLRELNEVKAVIHEYNALRPGDTAGRLRILQSLLGSVADEKVLIIQPFYCDYGKQIKVGRRFFANFNFTVLDEAPVTIGDDCFIGPNVSIYTACHSTVPAERNTRREWARPVSIGDNVWIGGSVTILPGVTIGDNVTIGAGSVVVHDIPSDTIAVGNPCRVVKTIPKE